MTQQEFIKAIIGKPWVNRASSFEAVDCWGLVMLYYEHVLNIKLPTVGGFAENKPFEECFNGYIDKWQTIDTAIKDGLVFTSYMGDTPTHVGICIGHGKALHARGSESQPGKVEIHALRAIERMYGKITLHKFTG